MRKSVQYSFFVVLLSAGIIAFSRYSDLTSWEDPVQQWAQVTFSHKFHTEEAEAECSDCHAAAETSTQAQDFLLPVEETCAECHEVEDESECSTCHAEDSVREAFRSPQREVIFNHQQHLARELDCATCHQGVEMAEEPSTAYLPVMADCISCHEDQGQNTACETCHSHVETRQPVSHVELDWIKEHKRLVRVDTPANDCSSCHTDNDCQSCHATAEVMFTLSDLKRPLPENRVNAFAGKGLVKQRVHDLNYVFTHGLDFRSKRSDCVSCHDQQQFCSSCHDQNQDSGFLRPQPMSHLGEDFTRLGVGSGGGRHAELARRDIASCAVCHDTRGQDPECVLCHLARSPGPGNDPKTHVGGFLNTRENGWHDDPGALCYSCHTNTRTAGIGFCGYCHGIK